MRIFDTKEKRKVDFIPIKKNRVKMYVCGPTLYDDSHLGHARSSIVFDLIYRVLKELRFDVTFVKNFTDIDDKIIKKAIDSNLNYKDITNKYLLNYLNDMEELNVRRADIEPKATDFIEQMIEFIQTLLDKGFAYKSNKDIYFDSSKDEKYLSISSHIQSEDESRHRIEIAQNKRNSKDFVLWKGKKEGDLIYFEAPFGAGRPGWHLECSVMIDSLLANSNENFAIDIHGGGADLLFPHHENEASQTRCAKNQELSKYWIHNGFVNINGEKMSKSLGNSFYLKDALKIYDGEILRFYLISTHYRTNFNFNEEDLKASKKRLDRLYRLKKRVYGVKKVAKDSQFESKILEALSDDFNISLSLSIVDEYISKSNDELDKNPKSKALKQKINSNIEFLNRVIGVGSKDAFEYFQIGISKDKREKIENLIQKRVEAKREKNFDLADKIRNEILEMGISIMDTPNETLWERS